MTFRVYNIMLIITIALRSAGEGGQFSENQLVPIDRFQSRDHFTIGRHIGAHVNSELVSREL